MIQSHFIIKIKHLINFKSRYINLRFREKSYQLLYSVNSSKLFTEYKFSIHILAKGHKLHGYITFSYIQL